MPQDKLVKLELQGLQDQLVGPEQLEAPVQAEFKEVLEQVDLLGRQVHQGPRVKQVLLGRWAALGHQEHQGPLDSQDWLVQLGRQDFKGQLGLQEQQDHREGQELLVALEWLEEMEELDPQEPVVAVVQQDLQDLWVHRVMLVNLGLLDHEV